ncbi:helix-turn-helix domain-containing protein [Bradyrhizobium sp. th.b2]|uniref:AraC family transcriptional regulator n=1 Tax=Bradyrhizobium sp. th-b2 TaxID=172088 RepID=UPI00048B0BD3|nr:helix-turn-helix domain-containing protein [Bradyrhizobium sp. th.b2]
MFATKSYKASDPDEYTHLIRGGRVELVVSGRGVFNASLTRVDLGQLWMQRGRESLQRTFRVVTPPDRVILWFLASPQAPMEMLSSPIGHLDLGLLSPGSIASQRSAAPSEWAAMSLPAEEFHRYSTILTGKEVLSHEIPQVLRPSQQPLLARLRRLHRAAIDLSELAQEVLSHPNAATGLQQHLIEAAFGVLAHADDQISVPGHHRQRIMARFEALIEANADRVLFVTEVCEAIGVTGRTFYNCCMHDLGMSAHRYLSLRRLHQAHWVLRMADPANTTVTEVATRHGFWELGRFSRIYRELFQESPSETLRQPAGGRLHDKNVFAEREFSKSA